MGKLIKFSTKVSPTLAEEEAMLWETLRKKIEETVLMGGFHIDYAREQSHQITLETKQFVYRLYSEGKLSSAQIDEEWSRFNTALVRKAVGLPSRKL